MLRHLFELYAHDFSPMTGADVDDATGLWTDDAFLANAWRDPHFHPYLLRANGHWAGFAWVEWGSYIKPDEDEHWLLEEFFIMRKYRGQGVAAILAQGDRALRRRLRRSDRGQRSLDRAGAEI